MNPQIKNNTGIIGFPIEHSLSPVLHNYWIRQNKILGEYKAYRVEKKGIQNFINSSINSNFLGFNITLPHKQNIIPFLDYISDEAKALKAVNTVLIKNGKTKGYNTDTYGFIENLNSNFPDWKKRKGEVVIYGAGGAARAVAWSLLKNNFSKINIVNRTKSKALKLIADMKNIFPKASLSFFSDYNIAIRGAVLLVNTTSLGMKGQPPLKLKLNLLDTKAIVYDLVYNPIETNLLKEAKKLNFYALDGLGMLLYQAVPAFRMWYGVDVKVDKKLREMTLNNY